MAPRVGTREAAARTGSPAHETVLAPAIAHLFQVHAEEIWRFLKFLGVSDQDLADALQEVFLVAHRKLPSFRGESSERAWLFGIALHIARTWRRRRRLLVPVLHEDGAVPASQEQDLQQRDTRELLVSALGAISEAQRDVFVLYEIQEVPMTQVAARVGCSLFTAYSRLRLARQRLRRILRQRGVER